MRVPPQATSAPGRAEIPPATPRAAPGAPSGAVVPPRPLVGLVGNAPPRYPPLALRRREQGRVVLRVTVSPAGGVIAVAVAQSSGSDLLDSAAMAAVRNWRFAPATRAGVPVEGFAEAPINFRLPD